MISVFPPKISDQVLAFDTNIVLLFLVRNESLPLRISFIAVALAFQVFLAQTIRLKNQTPKNLNELVFPFSASGFRFAAKTGTSGLLDLVSDVVFGFSYSVCGFFSALILRLKHVRVPRT